MADQKTPAAVALLDAVELLERIAANDRRLGIEGANEVLRAAKCWADEVRAADAQATLDACEQAAPRVRAEGVAEGLRMAAEHANDLAAKLRDVPLAHGEMSASWVAVVASWCEARAKEVER